MVWAFATISNSLTSSDNTNLVEFVAIGVLVLAVVIYTWWQGQQSAKVFVAGPILMATYATGSMQTMSEGTIGGMKYRFMVTGIGPDMNPDSTSGSGSYGSGLLDNADAEAIAEVARFKEAAKSNIIMIIELPAESQVHIVALGSESAAAAIDPTVLVGNRLVPVMLEGEFPKDFKLYADDNHQVELREVLDPSTMAVLADYCKEYSWEIYSNYLYVIESERRKQSDQSNMVTDTESLVRHLTPVMDRFERNPETTETASN